MPPTQPDRRNFGEGLRRLRRERSLTLGDVSRSSGLALVSVSDLERGREKDITTVPLYLDALGLTSEQKLVMGAAAEMAWKATK